MIIEFISFEFLQKDKKKKSKTEAKKLKELREGSQSPLPLSQLLNQSSSSEDDSSEDRQ